MNLQAVPRLRAFFRGRSEIFTQGYETRTHVVVDPVSHPRVAIQKVMMPITVDAGDVALLRHVVMGACGERVDIMRVQSVDRFKKMRLWIVLHNSAVSPAMDAVMRALPRAEFGHITPLCFRRSTPGVHVARDKRKQ